MKTLFVFDSLINIEKIALSPLSRNDTVYLFPLTSKVSVIAAFEKRIKIFAENVKAIQVAEAINSSANRLRDEYLQFIAELPGKVHYRGRNLKEIFAVDEQTSLWWFSLIAEKNTFKSDSFNRLAQLDAIIYTIKQEKVDKVIFGCQSEKLKNALQDNLHKRHIEFEIVPTRPMRGLKMRIRKSQKLLYLKHNCRLISTLFHTLLRRQAIKRQISPLRRAIPQKDNSLLFFTYYPFIDEVSARNAVFKSKFYIHLQDALENNKRDIMWIAMYVNNNVHSFEESLKYARRFIKKGYSIFFLEEFGSLGACIKAFFTVLKSGFKFLMLEKNIYAAHELRDCNIYPLFKDDWYASFIGETGYLGIMYYCMFKAVFKKIKAEKYLYLCEMHAWEKALISARDALGIKTSLYGYQSGTVSRILLNYFNHPGEISETRNYAMPRPDKIVCNGRLSCAYMKESGWSKERLSIVEALRYNYLKGYLDLQSSGKKQNIVFLAFSISAEESSSILNIVYEAFKDRKGVEVWLRPHPALRLENVFKLSGVSLKDIPFKIKNGRLEEILLKAKVVIAGESGVSIEAIACGCNVVIVEIPEWISMSPLRNIHSQIVKRADSVQALQEVVSNIFQEEYDWEKHAAEARRIINDFFCLNQKSDIPENFLKLLI